MCACRGSQSIFSYCLIGYSIFMIIQRTNIRCWEMLNVECIIHSKTHRRPREKLEIGSEECNFFMFFKRKKNWTYNPFFIIIISDTCIFLIHNVITTLNEQQYIWDFFRRNFFIDRYKSNIVFYSIGSSITVSNHASSSWHRFGSFM